MHRHGYKGRKFGRETDQRKALLRGLLSALFLNHSINTTLIKAKEMRRSAEKLVTIAKKGGLANRRLLIARLDSIEVADHLMDVVAPQIKRNSGYLRIVRTGFRKGDNAKTATISFVDPISDNGAQGLSLERREHKSEPSVKDNPSNKKETK